MANRLIKSDATIRAIRIGDQRKRLNDGDGLYLLLFVKGGAHGWRFDYAINGKRKTLSLGTYPNVLLSLARKKADEARQAVANNTDPSDVRKSKKAATELALEIERLVAVGLPLPGTLEAVANDWLDHRAGSWMAVTRRNIRASLERYVFPDIGKLPVNAIKPSQIRKVVQAIEASGATETSGRVFQRLRSIFRYAIAHEFVNVDPTYPLKPSEIFKPRRTIHRAALPQNEVHEFYKRLSAYGGDPTTLNALRLLILTAVRPGELRGANWSEFDEDNLLWRIPAVRMKMKTEHTVPLSRSSIQILQAMRPISGSDSLVFPSPFYPSKPLSENTLNSALARLGYKGIATAHGFRTLFSTAANEAGWPGDIVEKQLAHEERDEVRGAYNRASYLQERKRLMDWWAQYLDKLQQDIGITG